MQVLQPPEPNGVESPFVMDCLSTYSEGDGQLYGALLSGKMLYAKGRDQWYWWGGHHWQEDQKDIAIGLVKYVIDRYAEEADALKEEIKESLENYDESTHEIVRKSRGAKIKMINNKIKSLRQSVGRKSCLDFARTNFGNPFTIAGDEFDRDPWLLGVQNGVVDLRSGELYDGLPEQMVLKTCSCNYIGIDDDVDLSGVEQFLSEIYDGDDEKIAFIQRLFGYGITGNSNEHVFPFFLGAGRNGKSLLMESIMRVMGSYASAIPSDLFLASRSPRPAADAAVMKFEGLRLAVASEVEEGSTFAAAQIKKITGGDTLEGRNPYDKKLRTFTPTHLTVMLSNHEPNAPSGDKGFWDRTYLIRHKVRFVKHEPEDDNERPADPDIDEKLKALDEQFLSWMVIGCLEYQRLKGLHPPASVVKETAKYREDSDYIGQFLATCCKTDNPEDVTGATEIYTAFVLWYQETINNKKQFTPSQKVFGSKLKATERFKRDTIDGRIKYKGISLNYEWYQRMMDAARAGGS